MTTSTWNASASGDWSDASDWTGGVPNSSSATATIAQTGTYTVDIAAGETFAAGSVALNDAGATLEVDGMLNLTNTLTLTAGELLLTGTVNGGTINTGAGTFTSSNGTLNGVTVDGTINVSTTGTGLTITGGLSMFGAGGSGSGAIDIGAHSSGLYLSGTETVSNTTITFNSYYDSILTSGNGTITLAATTTIDATGNASSPYFGNIPETGSIINDGTIDAASNFRISSASFTNAGTINASQASLFDAFEIYSTNFSNSGTIALTNYNVFEIFSTTYANTGTISIDGTSTLDFQNQVTTEQLGQITGVAGATIDFAWSLDNVGKTYKVPTGMELVGTIDGGTIDGTIDLSNDSNADQNQSLTLSGDVSFVGSAAIDLTGYDSTLTLSGPMTLSHVTIKFGSADSEATLVSYDAATLASSVTINMTGTSGNGQGGYLGNNGGGYTGGPIVSYATINDTAHDALLTISESSFTNAGTITVSHGNILTIGILGYTTTFINTGTINVDGTSTLQYNCAITTAQLGTIDAAQGATLDFVGGLDNSGATYVLPTGLTLAGTIDGGTIEGTITVPPDNLSNNLSFLTLTGDITFEGAGGTGPGTINVTADGSTLFLTGPLTLDNVTINVGSSVNSGGDGITEEGAGTVTFGLDVTINQTASKTVFGFAGASFVNNGTINAAASDSSSFELGTNSFTNAGTIAISNGDTFIDDSHAFSNTGTITIDATSQLEFLVAVTGAQVGMIDAVSGAVINFTGEDPQLGGGLDNTGSTFVAPTGAYLSGVIDGGTIEGTVNIAANLPANPNYAVGLYFAGDVAFEGADGVGPGTLVDNGPLYLQGTVTLSNVTIVADDGTFDIPNYGDVTFASSTTISQSAADNSMTLEYLTSGPSTENTVVNDGTIDAASSGGKFEIEGLTFINAGSISVSDGDTFIIAPLPGDLSTWDPTSLTNTGTISIDGTSTLDLNLNITTAQLGVVDPEPGATINIASNVTLNNSGATLHLNNGVSVYGTILGGTLEGSMNETLSGGELLLSGNLTVANATIDIGAASTAGFAIVNIGGGIVTLASTATIDQTVTDTAGFLGNDANASDAASNGTVVIDGVVIAGVAGSALGVDPATLTNNGLLEADGGKIAVGSNDFTNLSSTTLTGGAYEATSGGTFEFVAFTTIVTDDATIILSGASSVMEDLNPTTDVTTTLESTLTSTGSGGTLEILADRNWTQATAFTNDGTIELGGGTFQVSSLTNSGTIDGFGTISAALTDSGALIAQGGTLGFQGGSFSGISGTLASGMTLGAGANATLQLPGNISITTLDGTIELLGASAAIQSLNGSTEVTVQSTLKTIGASGVLEVGDSYTSSNTISNAGTIQMAGGTLSTGTLTDSAGSNLDGYGTVASVFSDSGSVMSSDGALVFTGTGDTFNGALGGQEIDFGGGTDQLQSGASLTASTVAIYGNATVTFAASQNFAGTWTESAGTASFGANSLTLSGAGSTIAGSVTGTGTLTFAGGSQTIAGGASLGISNWALSGSDAAAVDTSLTYAGTFSAGAGTTLTMASGDTLTLTGTTTFAGSTAGPGKLVLSGGTETLDSGASFGAGLTLGGTAEANLSGSVTVSGTLTEGAGTTLTVASGGTLTLSGTGSTIAGTVTGSGALALSGGTDSVSRGATLGISNLSLSSDATLTLGMSLGYAGDLNEASGTTLALGAYTLNLSGTGSTIAGTISGTAGLTFSGGSQAIDSGASLATAHWSLTGSDAVSLNESLTIGGSFAAAAGTSLTIASGDTLTLNGASTFAGAISGSGATLAFSEASETLNTGTSLAVSDWTLSAGASTSIAESLSYVGTFSAVAGTTLNIALNDTLTLSGPASFAGAVTGGGALAPSGSSDTFDTGAHFSSKLSLRSGASVAVNGGVTVSGALTENTGATIAIGTGATLTLSGVGSSLIGTIDGAGTLALSGGSDSLLRGLSLGVADLTLSSGVTATLGTSLAYVGEANTAAGTTIALSAYTLNLSGTGSILSGTISGTGALSLTGGSQALDSGATLNEAKWSMSGSDAASVNENLSFSGTYTEGSGVTLTISSGDTLSLTGAVTLGATINGAGTVNFSNATLSGLTVGGTVTLNDVGTVLQSGQITLGDASGNAATLMIGSSASYTINANVGIGIGTSTATAIDDNGLLIKNGGTGTSKIAVGIVDNGHIEAATGTLDLVQGVTGTGAMQVDAGATLEFGASAASTLGMALNGANATLALANPSSFTATIAGFAAGDTIDLMAIKATLTVLETGDQLLITNGTNTVATLQLTGTYTGYIFNTVSDGHGGTDITATAPGSHTTIGGGDYDAALPAMPHRHYEAHASDWHFG